MCNHHRFPAFAQRFFVQDVCTREPDAIAYFLFSVEKRVPRIQPESSELAADLDESPSAEGLRLSETSGLALHRAGARCTYSLVFGDQIQIAVLISLGEMQIFYSGTDTVVKAPIANTCSASGYIKYCYFTTGSHDT